MVNRFHPIARQDRHRRIGGAHWAAWQLPEAGGLPPLSLVGARAYAAEGAMENTFAEGLENRNVAINSKKLALCGCRKSNLSRLLNRTWPRLGFDAMPGQLSLPEDDHDGAPSTCDHLVRSARPFGSRRRDERHRIPPSHRRWRIAAGTDCRGHGLSLGGGRRRPRGVCRHAGRAYDEPDGGDPRRLFRCLVGFRHGLRGGHAMRRRARLYDPRIQDQFGARHDPRDRRGAD